MKKLIALLLVAVMCLSFVACGGESGNTETPPSGENTENTDVASNPNYQILFNIICTEWVGENSTAIFNKDGTCNINGIDYTWEIHSIVVDDVTANHGTNKLANIIITAKDGTTDYIFPRNDTYNKIGYYLSTYNFGTLYEKGKTSVVKHFFAK